MEIIRRHFDDSGYYAYLLVDCSEPDFAQLKVLLKERGFSVLASGKSFRQAEDGRQYDYYVRLGTQIGGRLEKPSRDSVLSALRFAKAITTSATDDELSETTDVIASLRELTEAVKAMGGVLGDVRESHASLVKQQATLAKEQGTKLTELARSLSEDRKSMVESIVGSLRAQPSDNARTGELEDLLERLLHDESAMKAEVERLQQLCIEKELGIEDLRKQLEEMSAGSAGRRRSDPRSDVRVFQCCFPEVELIRGCESVLFFEFGNPSSALRKIVSLVRTPESVRGEAVESAKPWSELRCSTGSSNNGRIYFLRQDARVQVLVSTKQEQERDLKYLREHASGGGRSRLAP